MPAFAHQLTRCHQRGNRIALEFHAQFINASPNVRTPGRMLTSAAVPGKVVVRGCRR